MFLTEHPQPWTILASDPATKIHYVGCANGSVIWVSQGLAETMGVSEPIVVAPAGITSVRVPLLDGSVEVIDIRKLIIEGPIILHCGYGPLSQKWVVERTS